MHTSRSVSPTSSTVETGPFTPSREPEEISLLALGTVVLRRRRWIGMATLIGAVIGALTGLLKTHEYAATTVFIPQSNSGPTGDLALAASQFGIRLPNTGNSWGPPIYVELLNSRAVLEVVARDTVVVQEDGGRRVALMDLLEIDPQPAATQSERAVRRLHRVVAAAEDKRLGGVRLSATTPWPSVSLAIVQRLVREVDRFNLETRKSQAGAERQFAEAQARDAEAALRQSEDQLQSFLQTNRVVTSPQLSFERDRLQREITLRQQVYTTLVQSREEARMREVRDVPAITMLEPPQRPALPESRNTAMKTVVGALLGGVLGVILAFVAHAVSGARRSPSSDANEFFQVMDEATPRFLRGGSRS